MWPFSKPKKSSPRFTDGEATLIRNARAKISPFPFKVLYIAESDIIQYRKYGYASPEEAQLKLMNGRILTFLKENNSFNTLISISDELLKRFSESGNNDVINTLSYLFQVKYRIKKNDFRIKLSGNFYYPDAICFETPENTSDYYINLLNKLIDYIDHKN